MTLRHSSRRAYPRWSYSQKREMLLHDYLENFAKHMPGHHWAEMDGRVVTYAEADVLANRFANSLIASGITKGIRFGYLSRN